MSRPARVTMKEGSRSRVMSEPCRKPIKRAREERAMIAAHHGQFVVVGCTSWTAMTPPTDADVADGQVDLAEQQREDLGHGQHHEHRALLEEVDDVAGREENVDGG